MITGNDPRGPIVRLAGSKRTAIESGSTRRHRPPCTVRTNSGFGVHLLFATVGIGLEVGRAHRVWPLPSPSVGEPPTDRPEALGSRLVS